MSGAWQGAWVIFPLAALPQFQGLFYESAGRGDVGADRGFHPDTSSRPVTQAPPVIPHPSHTSAVQPLLTASFTISIAGVPYSDAFGADRFLDVAFQVLW
jgi:hypothetical protein